MTTATTKITADWAKKREIPLVHELFYEASTELRNRIGHSWPDNLFAQTEEPLRTVCMANTMVFRTDDGGPRKIHAACTYGISTVGTSMTVIVSRWAVCPEMPPNEQKRFAVALFESMNGKINVGDGVLTIVSEYDVWRQILLRHCGFHFIRSVDIQKFDRLTVTMYRFGRVKG